MVFQHGCAAFPYASAAVRAALTTTVMRVMAKPVPLEPSVLLDSPGESPYIEQGVVCVGASQKAQSVLGFLVRRDLVV